MRERYNRDLEMLLETQLEGNERVRAVVTAYEELWEDERILFRLAAGIIQDAVGKTREPGCRTSSEGNHPDKVQLLVRDLFKLLLEDHPTLLTESDIVNLTNRQYTQDILGLQLGGFPLLRRREAGRRGSNNDGQSRFYAKLYAGKFYLCSQWWRDDHLSKVWSARAMCLFCCMSGTRGGSGNGTGRLGRPA